MAARSPESHGPLARLDQIGFKIGALLRPSRRTAPQLPPVSPQLPMSPVVQYDAGLSASPAVDVAVRIPIKEPDPVEPEASMIETSLDQPGLVDIFTAPTDNKFTGSQMHQIRVFERLLAMSDNADVLRGHNKGDIFTIHESIPTLRRTGEVAHDGPDKARQRVDFVSSMPKVLQEHAFRVFTNETDPEVKAEMEKVLEKRKKEKESEDEKVRGLLGETLTGDGFAAFDAVVKAHEQQRAEDAVLREAMLYENGKASE